MTRNKCIRLDSEISSKKIRLGLERMTNTKQLILIKLFQLQTLLMIKKISSVLKLIIGLTVLVISPKNKHIITTINTQSHSLC